MGKRKVSVSDRSNPEPFWSELFRSIAVMVDAEKCPDAFPAYTSDRFARQAHSARLGKVSANCKAATFFRVTPEGLTDIVKVRPRLCPNSSSTLHF